MLTIKIFVQVVHGVFLFAENNNNKVFSRRKNLNKYYIIVIFLILLLLIGCQEKNKENTFSIEPGKGASGFILRESTYNEIFKKHDREYYNEKGLFFTFNEGKQLTSILITNKKYKTREGFSVGDSIYEIVEKYGSPKSSNLNLMKSSYNIGNIESYNYFGIFFLVDESIVIGIGIF